MKPGEKLHEDDVAIVKNFVDFLNKRGTKLLCLDFDLTLLSVHTGGDHVPEGRVRPVFIEMFKLASEIGLRTCIVTFHSMGDAVQKVATKAFEIELKDLPVRCPTNVPVTGSWWLGGKLPFIKHAWEDSFGPGGEEFQVEKVFLFDDDVNNIRLAYKNKFPALLFIPEASLQEFLEILRVNEDDDLSKFIQDIKPLRNVNRNSLSSSLSLQQKKKTSSLSSCEIT